MIIHIIKNDQFYQCQGKRKTIKLEKKIINLKFLRAFRGRPMTLIIRVNTGQNRTDDFEHGFHSNDTWGHIRRFIHNRYIYIIFKLN